MNQKNNKQDELLGFWENGADDLSGLHAIWGYAIEFFENQEGVYHNWGGDTPQDEKKQKILWIRNDEKTISIKFEEELVWHKVEYQVDLYVYGEVKWLRLTEKDKTRFWATAEPLYKLIQ
jgi:hypothetical protein